MSGKVVVNRSMSLDGFIAGPGHSMDWGGERALADFVAPDDVAEIAAATGAMLIGRRTWEVGARMAAEEPGSSDYPFSGPMFLLTHRPLESPDPEVRILTGDIGDAVATALDAAGGKNLEILGADVAGQCLQRGLVDEILVSGRHEDRPGTAQQHAFWRRHHSPLPRPQADRPDRRLGPDPFGDSADVARSSFLP
jgi:dihydrofolate reductase